MSAIQQLFQQAQLAEATYSNFLDESGQLITTGDDLVAALRSGAGEFSATQAADFVIHWKVVAHQPNLGLTENGYSATLFESLDEPGTFTYAIRGTEGLFSYDLLVEDVGIAVNGLAMNQIVDMYNDWTRVNHQGAGPYQAVVLEYQALETQGYLLALAGQFVPAFNMAANEFLAYLNGRTDLLLENGTISKLRFVDSTQAYETGDPRQWGLGLDIANGAVSVAGHSLGGHLAAAFTRLFPSIKCRCDDDQRRGFLHGRDPGSRPECGHEYCASL